jgi:serine/threonine protein kinase
MKNIIESDYAPINPIYSSELREIIGQCLNKNPEKRPSTNELITKKNILYKKKPLLDKIKPINSNSSKKSILKNTLVINTSIINDTNETKVV